MAPTGATKPVGTYTVTYVNNGKNETIKVDKGIKLIADKSPAKGGIGIAYRTSGDKNVTLPKLSQAEISLLKTFEMADKKAGISEADIKKLFQIMEEGRLSTYFNYRTPEGVKFQEQKGDTFNSVKQISVNVSDEKTKSRFGLCVNAPGVENYYQQH